MSKQKKPVVPKTVFLHGPINTTVPDPRPNNDKREAFLFITSSQKPNNLKQKCTQLPTPFLGTVFNAL